MIAKAAGNKITILDLVLCLIFMSNKLDHQYSQVIIQCHVSRNKERLIAFRSIKSYIL